MRVGMLAPMQCELQPIVRRLGMEGDGSFYEGRVGDGVEVVAMLTNIGMANGASAARRMLEHGVDHVMVVGIAGGVDEDVLKIGDVIVPETVIGRAMERTFRPTFVGDIVPRNVELWRRPHHRSRRAGTDGRRRRDRGRHGDRGRRRGVRRRGHVAWSVFRGISDFAGGGLIDGELFALTNPDGTADPGGGRAVSEGQPRPARGAQATREGHGEGHRRRGREPPPPSPPA